MRFFITAVLWSAIALVPAFAQTQPAVVRFSAVIETIEFKDIPAEQQRVILDRIQVRAGDILTAETRQRIGRELGKVSKGMTFTYKTGSVQGTAKLIISPDC